MSKTLTGHKLDTVLTKVDTEKGDKMDMESTKSVDRNDPAPAPEGALTAKTPEIVPSAEAAVATSPAVVKPEWLTREEAARELGKSLRTVDRLRNKGVLKTTWTGIGEPGTVHITTASVEAYLRRKIEPRPEVAMTTVEAAHYDGLVLQLQHKSRQVEELSGRLLEWKGAEEAKAAELAAERQKVEALAADLEAERARAAELAAAEEAKAAELAAERQKAEAMAAALEAERAKAAELAATLAAEQSKGFWRRLFGG